MDDSKKDNMSSNTNLVKNIVEITWVMKYIYFICAFLSIFNNNILESLSMISV